MGALILGVGTSSDQSGTVAVSAAAAQQAIRKAGISSSDIDLLINVGVYRDKNIFEPAMAALIQKELDLNPDPIRSGRSTFSLDIRNGGIGALNAMQIAASSLDSGKSRYVLIVSSDVHPSTRDHKDFPYRAAGSAFLLGRGHDAQRGFQSFAFDSKPQSNFGRQAALDPSLAGRLGRESMQLKTDPNFIPDALSFSLKKAKEFVAQQKLNAAAAFLISSELDAEFAAFLARGLGASLDATPGLYKEFGDSHSSTFGLGYAKLGTRIKGGSPILFVGVTSGLSFACAHYIA